MLFILSESAQADCKDKYVTCSRGQGTSQHMFHDEPAFSLWIKGECGCFKGGGKTHVVGYAPKNA